MRAEQGPQDEAELEGQMQQEQGETEELRLGHGDGYVSGGNNQKGRFCLIPSLGVEA